jgi:hypothetical protein
MFFFAIEMTRRRFASTIPLPGFSNDWVRPAFYQNPQKKASETTILRFHRRHLLEVA